MTGIAGALAVGSLASVALGERLSTMMATTVAIAAKGLWSAAARVRDALFEHDLERARCLLPALCGRDPEHLDVTGVATAAVESVAENTVDAIVAPLFWASVAGAAGVLTHRAVNTLDAQVGHMTEAYRRFGWASARADDLLAFVPARITAALVAACRPSRTPAVWRTVTRDASRHASPNAGVSEAAFAGALGLTLGGPVTYDGRLVHRPHLGEGPRPVPEDITRAIRLSRDVTIAAGIVVLLFAAASSDRQTTQRPGRSSNSDVLLPSRGEDLS